MRKKLGVNIDHVGTLRQVRKADYPDPVAAASVVELAGADSVTVHLREDRRHIIDRDIYLLRETIRTRMNLEMAIHPEIVKIALKVRPDDVCIVPEKREEITTEGGLDVITNRSDLKDIISQLHQKGIIVSLFIDPDKKQVESAKETGSDYIEIHTGRFANADTDSKSVSELEKIIEAAVFAESLGLGVNAGHGLNYQNVYSIALIDEIETLNIGHSIIARSLFTGMDRAVKEMLALLDRAERESLSNRP